jgi:3'(2'), 5'-bisphosphate nucleotidase
MDSQAYLVKAIQAAIKAGKAILEVYHSDFSVEYKTDDSPLTLADRRSHEIIVNNLGSSDIPILSEEGQHITFEQRKAWHRLWIADPLDGTKEFVKRNGEFTVNIALVENKKPVIGVIFVPDKKDLYFAASGLGAFKTTSRYLAQSFGDEDHPQSLDSQFNKIIDKSTRLPATASSLGAYTIVGSRSHSTPDLEAYVADKRREFGNVEFIAAGSSLKFCVVAEGLANVYPRLAPTMEWDTAAGQAIAENAGATVLAHKTQIPLTYNKEDLYNPWFIVSREI